MQRGSVRILLAPQFSKVINNTYNCVMEDTKTGINLTKKKTVIVLENDLQFNRKEDEDSLISIIEVKFNGHEIGHIRHTVKARIDNNRITGYDYYYVFSSYTNILKSTTEYTKLNFLITLIRNEIDLYVENAYHYFNLPKLEVKINESLFDESEKELKVLKNETTQNDF